MGSTSYTLVDGELLAEYRQGSERDYVGDALGSTVALLDGSQQFTDRWTYWPYGEERTRTGATPTPFRFVGTWGYYQDAAACLYVRARYYRPGSGRWQTVDPLWWGRPGGRETYQYCDASPIGMNDPKGLIPVNIEGCTPAQADWIRKEVDRICQNSDTLDRSCVEPCNPCSERTGGNSSCFSDVCGSTPTIRCSKDGDFPCNGTGKARRGHPPRRVCAVGTNLGGKSTIVICQRSWAGPNGPGKCDTPGCQMLHEMLHACGHVHRGTKEQQRACWDCYRGVAPSCQPYSPS